MSLCISIGPDDSGLREQAIGGMIDGRICRRVRLQPPPDQTRGNNRPPLADILFQPPDLFRRTVFQGGDDRSTGAELVQPIPVKQWNNMNLIPCEEPLQTIKATNAD